ncbi:acyl-CoA dehydrogenase, partial [Prauserella sp. PE36]
MRTTGVRGATVPRQELPGLDLVRLRAHLDECSPGLVQGPLTGTMLEGGRSNLTYVVTDGTGRWVVRRPPLGQVMPTAHDMTREHRVLGALRGTDVPVPGVFSLCRDTDVIGAPFYVMKFVEGLPYRAAAELAALGPERTTSIVNALVDTLAVVHDVDPETVGLSDFGRPEGFLERQLRRWKKQLDASRSR